METVVLIAFVELFHASILHIFFKNSFGLKRSNVQVLSGWILCVISINIINSFVYNNIINLMLILIFYYAILFFYYKGNWKQKILILVFVYVLGMLSEISVYIIQFVMGRMIQVDFTKLKNFYFIGSVCSKFILFLFIKIIDFISNKRKKTDVSLSDYIEIFTVPVASVIISYAIFIKEKYNIFGMIDIFAIGLLAVINLVTFYLYEKIQKKAEIEFHNMLIAKQNEYYVAQYQEMQYSWDNLRTFKHDIDKHYIIMKSYLENNNFDLLKKYLHKLTVQADNQYLLAKTQNILIDAIINYKANYANQFSISISNDLAIPSNQCFPSDDIAIILGNILDNAIEATKEVEIENRNVELKLKYDIPNLYIEVKNPYIGDRIKDINNNYLTSKKDVINHGIGLNTVHSIVEKYHGVVHIMDQENIFDVKILLYNL
ncbi:MAG TPA: GHKL domain-containing protein [Lachnospiraceae bacterium]|nr:GHKL domain-containing protein [Lachnospiraceae bacterium]